MEPDFSLGIHCRERDKGVRVTETLGRLSTRVAGDHPETKGGDTHPTKYVSILCQLGDTEVAVEWACKDSEHFGQK